MRGEEKGNSGPSSPLKLDELGQLPDHSAPAGTMRWKGFALGERDSPLGVGRCTKCRGRVPDVVIPSRYRSPLPGGERIADPGRRHCIHKQTSPLLLGFRRNSGRLGRGSWPSRHTLTSRSADAIKGKPTQVAALLLDLSVAGGPVPQGLRVPKSLADHLHLLN